MSRHSVLLGASFRCSVAVREACPLQSAPLAPHIVIAVLAVFPVLYLTPLGLFRDYQLVVLSPFPFHPAPWSSSSEEAAAAPGLCKWCS